MDEPSLYVRSCQYFFKILQDKSEKQRSSRRAAVEIRGVLTASHKKAGNPVRRQDSLLSLL